MLCPVVCLTCGCPIGDKEDLFREMRAAKVRSVLDVRDTDVYQAMVDPGLQIDCSDILDALGVPRDRDCCRIRLTTAMVFTDLY